MGKEVRAKVESKSARVMSFMAAPKLAAAVMALCPTQRIVSWGWLVMYLMIFPLELWSTALVAHQGVSTWVVH